MKIKFHHMIKKKAYNLIGLFVTFQCILFQHGIIAAAGSDTEIPEEALQQVYTALDDLWGDAWEIQNQVCVPFDKQILNEDDFSFRINLSMQIIYKAQSAYDTWELIGICEALDLDPDILKKLSQEELLSYLEEQGFHDPEEVRSFLNMKAVNQNKPLHQITEKNMELYVEVFHDENGDISEIKIWHQIPEWSDELLALEQVLPGREALLEQGRKAVFDRFGSSIFLEIYEKEPRAALKGILIPAMYCYCESN